MKQNDLKVILIHLSIFSAYSALCYRYGIWGILQLGIVVFHTALCGHFATSDSFKNSKAHWVSFFLILLIGFGVCTQLPFPVG